ncbi:MAG TPA: Gfo/Idh/MocA family oxidoreductase [Opitutaceae bacterium]|jgi:predicted dehydrogenase|nr:Gfo/Idh/MocA family oxidoreductase [Opitutaceae bacterium]
MLIRSFVASFLLLAAPAFLQAEETPPVPLAVVGLEHDHARLLFPMLKGRGDLKLVGIVESDPEIIGYYEEHFHLCPSLFFPTFGALVAKEKVRAVAAFTSTAGHRAVIEECAPLGIDVMMEKPMATNLDDARAIAAAAAKGGIEVVVNFETTWYPSNALAFDLVNQRRLIGSPRKILVQDGNPGPSAIKATPYFLKWLTDPALGGGANMDFGCYGADLVTWIMKGERPKTVTAVMQNFQPATYSRVEDESTIVLGYPTTQAVIQASWNWPYGRKDMEIYGESGSVMVPNREFVRVKAGDEPARQQNALAITGPCAEQLSYLSAVVRGEIKPTGMSSIALNMIVTEILDAARESARTGRTVPLPPRPAW